MNINQLVGLARKGNLEARNEILKTHRHIIDMVLARFKNIPLDEGTKRYGAILGIYSAIQRFDGKKGNFGRYAYICAYQKAKREMSGDRLIKLPISVSEEFLKVGRAPYGLLSVNARITTEDGELEEIPFDELSVTDSYKDQDIYIALRECINELNPLEQDVIYNAYGFKSMTLKQIGLKHDVSHEWARQKCSKTFKKLQRLVKNKIKQKYGY